MRGQKKKEKEFKKEEMPMCIGIVANTDLSIFVLHLCPTNGQEY